MTLPNQAGVQGEKKKLENCCPLYRKQSGSKPPNLYLRGEFPFSPHPLLLPASAMTDMFVLQKPSRKFFYISLKRQFFGKYIYIFNKTKLGQ
jgi:hypothetical protein